ncbi:hypothetical protein Poli38472_012305 [Pythium oligandrum]|uniref:Ankyrin repeat protein n=1 Tax=Pythium oligandrum TaxID=41045 RepID=A0A8K1CQ51_PYTOL|nr:hypothetical protein Poli38472_012305 [Pythium oligandrum]|eukprot:TMW67189.1 hypothetical protein Poli38472_012305 [Pythium oligandrum]
MMETTPRALFLAARDGDLNAVRAYFNQSDVVEDVARVNAAHRATRVAARERNVSPFRVGMRDPPRDHGTWLWYAASDQDDELRGGLFDLIVLHGRLHVLEWLLSADAMEIIGDTMVRHFDWVDNAAVAHNCVDVLEMVLTSDLFVRELTSAERQHTLQEFLHRAIEYHRSGFIRLLVAHGADVNLQEAPLGYCVAKGDAACLRMAVVCGMICEQPTNAGNQLNVHNPELVRAFIEAGGDVGGDDEWTPLHTACRYRVPESVEILLTLGFVDVNAVATDGVTPLVMAVVDEQSGGSGRPIASLLLSYGADVHLRFGRGNTVLHAMVDGGSEATLACLVAHAPELINDWERLSLLLSNGGNPCIKDNGDESAYQVLMRYERGRANIELVRALIDAGLDTRGEGVSALHLACQARALESVEVLITS